MPLDRTSARKRRTAPAVDLEKSPWTIREVAAFFGGSKPLHPATVYRGVKEKRIPPPYHPSPGIARWDPCACRAAQGRMIAESDKAAPGR